MHIAAVVMVALSIAAGIAEMRDSDPAGRGYALVIPIVFGHIAALIPALIASRSSSRAAIARRAPLRYVLASGFGLLTAGALYPLVPRRGPPPEPPAPTIERVAAALAAMVNAQGAFARITMTGEPGRVVRVHGRVNDLKEYDDLKRRTMLFSAGWVHNAAPSAIRFGVSVADGIQSQGSCQWTRTEPPLLLECLCGGGPLHIERGAESPGGCEHAH